MTDLHYQHPKLVSIYDLGNGWSNDRDFYLSLAGKEPKRVLDLGCGTGLLCNAYAEKGHSVTGVEPSASMLAVARGSRFGDQIEWAQSSAQDFCGDKGFDLIIMTGHAFQALLDDGDISATFSRVHELLAPDGLFAFESRNPAIDWARQWDGMRRELNSPSGIVRETFKVRSTQGDRIVFETQYAFSDETLVSVSELRFLSHEAIARRLELSGLRVESLLGGWDSGAFDAKTSREMIFLAHGK